MGQCHREGSDDSVHAAERANVNVTRVDISDRTLAAVAFGIAMLALGLTILAAVLSQYSERETKLMREDLRVMSIALARHGIDTDEHAIEKGEAR